MQALADCSDTIGSFECECKNGYTGNGADDECVFQSVGPSAEIITIEFTSVLQLDPVAFRTNTTFQKIYKNSVARAANVDESSIRMASIKDSVLEGRRLLAVGTAVTTEADMPQGQFEDVKGSLEENLKSQLARQGIGMASMTSPGKKVEPVTRPPTPDPEPEELVEEPEKKKKLDDGMIGGFVALIIGLIAICGGFAYFLNKKTTPPAPVAAIVEARVRAAHALPVL